MLSYINGIRIDCDVKPYLGPITNLPSSETEGLPELEARGQTLVTVPPPQQGYIERGRLEDELYYELATTDHHRIVTLVGRGGIGKTWLALTVLNRIAQLDKFSAILWFSARDIDLLPDGAKLVKPHVLTEKDIANEFSRLVAPYVMNSESYQSKDFNPMDFLRENLTRSSLGGPILFVFDNFETVKSPAELFSWLDSYLRLPNKALITTRFRDFKGDNPVHVHGMTEDECNKLVDRTAKSLGVFHLITEEYRQDLYTESGGHPYVVKILLGEVAKFKQARKVERIIATQDDLLETLFERTFSRLTLVAKRVFLTLCSWKSMVPQLALEAILLRPSNEKMDVTQAIDELYTSSLIEITDSEQDNQPFLSVPLVASVFGQRKLEITPMKSAIQADVELLQYFGAAKPVDIQQGIAPRVKRLFQTIASKVYQANSNLEEYIPILELIARKYPPAWLLLSELYEEQEEREKVKDSLLSYLEFSTDGTQKRDVWRKLAYLYRSDGEDVKEVHARIEVCQFPETRYEEISSTANILNQKLRKQAFDEKAVMARILVELMESRISEANATDCSRLAWLCLHMYDNQKALQYAHHGLQIEPDNVHCRNIISSFNGE
ncbi:MAG: hypothetical protein H6673_07885 [Anaerolineales bacterium]|nr:hypothetical protein [Anaerolineales bacterium]